MSNRIKMAMIQSILSRHEKRWSNRRIARELGIHRETVSRYVRLAAEVALPHPAAADLAAGEPDPKPANAPIGSTTAATGASRAEKALRIVGGILPSVTYGMMITTRSLAGFEAPIDSSG
jgi:DNA-binding transcriptional MocR family regulator